MYNNDSNFFQRAKQTVYKWWCVVYKPVYKLFHHGYWPAEKEPYYHPSDSTSTSDDSASTEAVTENVSGYTDIKADPDSSSTPDSDSTKAAIDPATGKPYDQEAQNRLAQEMAARIMKRKQGNIDDLVSHTEPNAIPASSATSEEDEPEIDLSKVDQASLDKANEIMARLAREAAEDEARKQAEIASAKAKAAEDERLASILQSTRVDISAYIQEGMAHRNDN